MSGLADVDIAFLHFAKTFGDDLFHGVNTIPQMNINSAGGICDLLETGFVQTRFNKLTIGIFNERGSALFLRHRDDRAFC